MKKVSCGERSDDQPGPVTREVAVAPMRAGVAVSTAGAFVPSVQVSQAVRLAPGCTEPDTLQDRPLRPLPITGAGAMTARERPDGLGKAPG